MGADSAIEWTHHTFSPWRGCTKVSPGCEHCYAETLSKRNPSALGTWGPGGTRVVAAESYWRQPLRWNRDAAAAGDRRRVFCASLADVFEDWRGHVLDAQGNVLWRNPQGDVIRAGLTPVGNPIAQGYRPATLDDVRRRLFRLIEQTPHLDWLLLTKRPEAIGRLWAARDSLGDGRVLRNLWLGTTCEDQRRADERIPHLLAVPAAVRFLSVEPLLGPVVLPLRCEKCGYARIDQETLGDHYLCRGAVPGIDWVIVGGESGPGARTCEVAWIRDVVRQCREASVPVFVKQVGSSPRGGGDVGPDGIERCERWSSFTRPADAKGGDPQEWPSDLRVREFPREEVRRV